MVLGVVIDTGHCGSIVGFRVLRSGFISGFYHSSAWSVVIKSQAASSLATRSAAAIFGKVVFLATIEAFIVLLLVISFFFREFLEGADFSVRSINTRVIRIRIIASNAGALGSPRGVGALGWSMPQLPLLVKKLCLVYEAGKCYRGRCYTPALSLCHALIFFSILPLCVPLVCSSISILDYFGSCRNLDV